MFLGLRSLVDDKLVKHVLCQMHYLRGVGVIDFSVSWGICST